LSGAWRQVFVLSLGGVMGVNARYWLTVWMARWSDPRFPWATFTINVSGSFAIGFLSTVLTARLPHPYFRLLVLVGFLGGYTTFSSFSLEALVLWERGDWGRAVGYVVGSVAMGLMGVVLGVVLARGVTGLPKQALAAPRSTPLDQVEAPPQA
jgi:fluoride exporter